LIIHPVILLPKIVFIIIIVVVLALLHSVLTPGQFTVAVILSIIAFAIFLIVFWTVLLRLMRNPKSRFAKMIILTDTQRPEDGYRASSNINANLVGSRGKAISALRPSGTALVAGKRVAVETRGDFLPAGSDIEVIAFEGSRVVVQQVHSISE
jgi:membrane-bound serine protease (ClpP class)